MDTKDKHGRLPLSHATRYGSEALEKLLVARDDVKVDTSRGTRRSGVHNNTRCSHVTAFVSRLCATGWHTRKGRAWETVYAQ